MEIRQDIQHLVSLPTPIMAVLSKMDKFAISQAVEVLVILTIT